MIFKLNILNPSLDTVAVFFDFISCIWTTQYYGTGEFELVVEYSKDNFNALQIGNYIVKNNTNEIAVIEKVRYDYSADKGGTITASGRMAICLLERRLMCYIGNGHPNIYTYCQDGERMEAAARRSVGNFAVTTMAPSHLVIDNLLLGVDQGYTETASKRVSTYLNLYRALTSFLATKNMAHKITYSTNGYLVYKVYKGTDRSDTMTFSRNIGNLRSFSYEVDSEPWKNWFCIGGDGEALQRTVLALQTNGYPHGGGTERREHFYSASSNKEDGESDAAYNNILIAEAEQECGDLIVQRNVEAEIDMTATEYGKDWNVGDVILISDVVDYKPRITAVIESQTDAGYAIDVEFNGEKPEEEDE